MKILITFLLLIFFTISVNAQCVWDNDHGLDPFTGTISRATRWKTMFKAINRSISFQVVEYSQDTLMFLNVKVHQNMHYRFVVRFNDESKIMLKSGNTFITIKLFGGIVCREILLSYGEFLPEDIEFLKHNNIDMVRIFYAEGYDDFKIQHPKIIIPQSKYLAGKISNTSDYFIRTLNCFE